MGESSRKKRTRENWVDHTKVIACVLVALGHMLQGLVQAGVLEQSSFLDCFDQMIYSFHVQLFFICSGYLYQKHSVVDGLVTWKDHLIKKLLALGIPYFTFSLVTWGLKAVFSGSVNNAVGNLWQDLFVVPQSPYWYLYTLFFVFLITPTFRSKKMCFIGLAGALLLQLARGTQIYAISQTANFEIWFVLGMAICVADLPSVMRKWSAWIGYALLAGFILASTAVWSYGVENNSIRFLLGMVACFGVLLLSMQLDKKENRLSKYTMPVFLMHTIFAAGFRTVLIKSGITNSVVHIAVGLGASFLCPGIAAVIMERIKLDFLFYPGKYIRNNR